MSVDPKPIPELLALLAAKATDYEIDEQVGDRGLIGQGGMASVFAVRHRELGARMAIKAMNAADEQVAQRFRNEARVAARVQSHHIARVYHLGTLAPNRYYMVMEYLVGNDLEQYLKRRGKLPAAEAIDYVLQACEGVAAAHSLGIIHRDLKPANLIRTLRPDGDIEIKVLDFGLAKVNAELHGMEKPGTAVVSLMGSPAYMSPEQARSTKNVDERTDLWALGVLLYEAVSGGLPFSGQGFELLMNITTEEPQILDGAALGLPDGLGQIVARCLERDLGKRYGNLADLAMDLAALGEAESKHAARRVATLLGRVPGPSKLGMLDTPEAVATETALGERRTADGVTAMATAPAKSSAAPPPLRRRLLVAAIGLVVLAAAAAVIIKARRYPRDHGPAVLEAASQPAARASDEKAPPRSSAPRERTVGFGGARGVSSPDPELAEPTPSPVPGPAKPKASTTKDVSGPAKVVKKNVAAPKKKSGKRHH